MRIKFNNRQYLKPSSSRRVDDRFLSLEHGIQAKETVDGLLHSSIGLNQVMVLQAELLLDYVRAGNIHKEELERNLSQIIATMMRTGEILRRTKKAIRNPTV
jgi:hypothetical protein